MKRLVYNDKIPNDAYKCPKCGTLTFEGDRYHWTMFDSNGGHCIVGGRKVN